MPSSTSDKWYFNVIWSFMVYFMTKLKVGYIRILHIYTLFIRWWSNDIIDRFVDESECFDDWMYFEQFASNILLVIGLFNIKDVWQAVQIQISWLLYIWIYTVCKGGAYPCSAGPELIHYRISENWTRKSANTHFSTISLMISFLWWYKWTSLICMSDKQLSVVHIVSINHLNHIH